MHPMGIRVMFYIDGLNCGGKERQLTEIVKGLCRCKNIDRNDILMVSMQPEGHYDKYIEKEGVRIVRLIRSLRFDPLIMVRLRKVIKAFKPDIVHTFSLMTSVYTMLTRKSSNIRFIDGSVRDSCPEIGLKEKVLQKMVFREADLIIANSRAGIEAKRVPAKKGLLVYNGFDFERVKNIKSPGEVRESLGINTEKVVGMVASFSKYKDWDTFLSAAEIISKRRDDVTFLAVGDGENIGDYRQKYCNNRRLLFTGLRQDVEEIINIFNIGVLCSYSKTREGISNSVMEYMALCKPAVVTSGGGTEELVINSETGYVVPPESPDILSEKIICLLENQDTSYSMGMKGRNRLMEEFSLDKMIKKLVSVYEGMTQT